MSQYYLVFSHILVLSQLLLRVWLWKYVDAYSKWYFSDRLGVYDSEIKSEI